jgi:hypothetical protein
MTTDKESLESTLYQLQQDIAQIESRRQQLELDNQDLNIKRENLISKFFIMLHFLKNSEVLLAKAVVSRTIYFI